MEHSTELQRIINDVRVREKRQADTFLSRNKDYLDRGREAAMRQQGERYFEKLRFWGNGIDGVRHIGWGYLVCLIFCKVHVKIWKIKYVYVTI